jgi:hypothetical protein
VPPSLTVVGPHRPHGAALVPLRRRERLPGGQKPIFPTTTSPELSPMRTANALAEATGTLAFDLDDDW